MERVQGNQGGIMKSLITGTIAVLVSTSLSVSAYTEYPTYSELSQLSEPTHDNFIANPSDFPELFCLAQNIYFEASIDHMAGMYAVADVTLNRVKDSRFPDTICGVVKSAKLDKKGNPKRNQCAFSWYCDGKSDKVPEGSHAWKEATEVAWNAVMNGKFVGLTENSTHYHTPKVNPYWASADNMSKLGRIGHHVFYKWER